MRQHVYEKSRQARHWQGREMKSSDTGIISGSGQVIPVLYEDNHLLVVNKPSGMLVQGDATGDVNLLAMAKQYLKEKYNKPGNVYLGLVHRLDRPVSGVLVLARTSKAAARLSEQIRHRLTGKRYLALVEGPVPKEGRMEDAIVRKGRKAWIDRAGKKAVLEYRLNKVSSREIQEVTIDLQTGRHHQIRLQFSHRGWHILGDHRYGSSYKAPEGKIALHCQAMHIEHPVGNRGMTFYSDPEVWWQKIYESGAGSGPKRNRFQARCREAVSE